MVTLAVVLMSAVAEETLAVAVATLAVVGSRQKGMRRFAHVNAEQVAACHLFYV